MKFTTKAITLTLAGAASLALLGVTAASAHDGVRVQYKCTSTAKGKCPPPPVPPAPPAPPAAPAPPAPPAAPMPVELDLPDVPAAAHAACAAKAEGARFTYVLRKGETMTGVCEREGGKMVFQLREYELKD